MCNSWEEACKIKQEINRQKQVAHADAKIEAFSSYLSIAMDSLNEFGPAGIELGMGLRSAGYALKYVGGLISATFAAKAISTSISVVNAGEDVWKLGWSTRGLKIDELLGNNLGKSFPIVDRLSDRVVTSIKSYDIANSYQKQGAWLSQLKTDIRTLNNLSDVTGVGTNGSRFTLTSSMYDSKVFQIAIPDIQLSSAQVQAIIDATEYAKGFGISVTTTIVK
jgi:hypothetical protein